MVGSDGAPVRLLSSWETYFTLLKAFICTGFLYIPRTFVESGWVYSSITFIAVSALITYTQFLFLEARVKVKARSMSDLAYKTIGTPGRMITDFFVAASQFSFVVSIIYFINLNVTPLIFGRHEVTKKATLISQSINGTVTTITEIKSKTITHSPVSKN